MQDHIKDPKSLSDLWVDLLRWCAGVAWLSSVRVVKCLVKSLNERNPRIVLILSRLTRHDKCQEAKIMSNIHDPYELGFTRVTMISIITR
jgi:hypothetical protein